MFNFRAYIISLGFQELECDCFAPSKEYEARIQIDLDKSVSYSSGEGQRLEVPMITSETEAMWFLYFTGFADKPNNILSPH